MFIVRYELNLYIRSQLIIVFKGLIEIFHFLFLHSSVFSYTKLNTIKFRVKHNYIIKLPVFRATIISMSCLVLLSSSRQMIRQLL
jgi:hypothetical protein